MGSGIVIMNLSGVYSSMNMPSGILVDCSDIEGCSCYCDQEAEEQIKSRMAAACPSGPSGIHFIDSGDYHYITKFWTDRIRCPFNLILFDHHPDMQEPEFPGPLSCGGWVRNVLFENQYSRKALIAGTDPELSANALPVHDRVLLADELNIPGSPSQEFLSFLDERLPVYLSIDKDVLSTDWARTDWDQGTMALPVMKNWLRAISDRFIIIGVDICGEIPFNKGGQEAGWELNSGTNLELSSLLEELLP